MSLSMASCRLVRESSSRISGRSNCFTRITSENFTMSNISSFTKTIGHKTHIELTKCRSYASWAKKVKKIEVAENTVYNAGKKKSRTDRVYCWGWAATGALGKISFMSESRGRPPKQKVLHPHRLGFFADKRLKVEAVSCGYGFSIFLCKDSNGKSLLYGTGVNTDSQLSFQKARGSKGRIFDYLVEPVPIQLPLLDSNDTQITRIGCGRAHTVVATSGEGVYTFGNNAYGQLGRKMVEGEIFRGSQQINKIKAPGTIKQICCGQDHTIIVTEAGEVYSCGLGSDGQTGLGHYNLVDKFSLVRGDIEGEKIVHVSSKADCVLAVSDKGDLFGWGNSEYNQLSSVAKETTQVSLPKRLPFTNIGKVTKTAAAGSMCAVVNDEGEVFVWGYGILGKGPKLGASHVPQIIPPTLFGQNEFAPDTRVVDIQSGLTHFMAQTNSGEIFAWGRNKTACLGLSNDLDQFFPFKVIVPAEVEFVGCGVDHTIALCKSFV